MGVLYRYTVSQTSARFLVRMENGESGTAAISVGRQSSTGSMNSGVDDGTGVVVVSGLSANTRYNYTILANGEQVSGTLVTDPDAAWTGAISFFSCIKPQRITVGALRSLIKYRVRAQFRQGDSCLYADSAGTAFGVDFADVNTTGYVTDVTKYYPHYRASLFDPALRYCNEHIQTPEVEDDHAWGLDDFPSVTRCIAVTGEASPTTFCGVDGDNPNTTNFDAIYAVGYQALQSYQKHNPRNTDAGQPASALYFEKRMGHVTVIALSCVGHDDTSYRDVADKTDGAGKSMLGATQLAWVKARMLAAEANSAIKFIIISTGKKLWKAVNDNGDTWAQYANERNAWLTWIAANITKTVVFIAGDRHIPDICDDGNYVCFCGCAIGQTNNTDGQGSGWGSPQRLRLKVFGVSGDVLDQAQAQTIVKIYPDKLYVFLDDVVRGDIGGLWFGENSSRPINVPAYSVS